MPDAGWLPGRRAKRGDRVRGTGQARRSSGPYRYRRPPRPRDPVRYRHRCGFGEKTAGCAAGSMEKSVKPARVLIVDDSAVVRQALSDLLASDPRLEIMGTAAD